MSPSYPSCPLFDKAFHSPTVECVGYLGSPDIIRGAYILGLHGGFSAFRQVGIFLSSFLMSLSISNP